VVILFFSSLFFLFLYVYLFFFSKHWRDVERGNTQRRFVAHWLSVVAVVPVTARQCWLLGFGRARGASAARSNEAQRAAQRSATQRGWTWWLGPVGLADWPAQQVDWLGRPPRWWPLRQLCRSSRSFFHKRFLSPSFFFSLSFSIRSINLSPSRRTRAVQRRMCAFLSHAQIAAKSSALTPYVMYTYTHIIIIETL